MGPDTKLRLLHVCVIQMLRLYLPRHTLRRALGQSLQAGVQNGMAAISNTTAACPSHPSSLRAGSTAQVSEGIYILSVPAHASFLYQNKVGRGAQYPPTPHPKEYPPNGYTCLSREPFQKRLMRCSGALFFPRRFRAFEPCLRLRRGPPRLAEKLARHSGYESHVQSQHPASSCIGA
jgi:hypothetical protein